MSRNGTARVFDLLAVEKGEVEKGEIRNQLRSDHFLCLRIGKSPLHEAILALREASNTFFNSTAANKVSNEPVWFPNHLRFCVNPVQRIRGTD